MKEQKRIYEGLITE
nr:InfA [Trichosanthes parviflora]